MIKKIYSFTIILLLFSYANAKTTNIDDYVALANELNTTANELYEELHVESSSDKNIGDHDFITTTPRINPTAVL